MFRIGTVCSGLLTESDFDVESGSNDSLPIVIALVVESYAPLLQRAVDLRPGCSYHNDFRSFVLLVESDPTVLDTLDLDIVTITPPCYSETIMREYNDRDEHPDGDLFTEYTPRFARAWAKTKRPGRPRVLLIEITPSREMTSHRRVQRDVEQAGFDVAVVDRLPSCFTGDHTHRDRWWLLGVEGPVLPPNVYQFLTSAPSIAADILDPPHLVSDELWVHEEYSRYHGKMLPPDPHEASEGRSFAVLHGFLNDLFVKEMKVYDPSLGPLPCITRSALLRVYVEDYGVRFLSLEELARASSFSGTTIDYLSTLPFERAMTMIAGAVPGGMLRTIYRAALDALQRHHEAVHTIEDMILINDDRHRDVVGWDYDATEPFLPMAMFKDVDDVALTISHELLPADVYQELYDIEVSDDPVFDSNGARANKSGDVTSDAVTVDRTEPLDAHTDIDITTKSTTSSPQGFPSLSSIYSHNAEITEPVERRNASIRAKRLHDVHHVGPHQLEKIIATTTGHGCKPGDSRYVGPCDKCDATIDTFKVTHTTKGISWERVSCAPGEQFFIDGMYPTVVSKWGGHKYIIVAVCVKSSYIVLYYVRDLTARSFVSFINYLRTLVRVRTKYMLKKLYGDYFSTHLDKTTVAVMRAQYSIEFEACPPYLHQRNAYVEGLIRILKIGIRARLPALIGKTIHGQTIVDATPYYNLAAEHKAQSLNSTPSTTLERDLGFPATRNQFFVSGDTPHVLDPEVTKLHPFATDVIVIEQKKKSSNAMEHTAERGSYLFSGAYNFFAHQYTTSPQTHVILQHKTGKLQVTAKCLFPYLKTAEFRAAVAPTIVSESTTAPATDPADADTDTLFDQRSQLPVRAPAPAATTASRPTLPLPPVLRPDALAQEQPQHQATDERPAEPPPAPGTVTSTDVPAPAPAPTAPFNVAPAPTLAPTPRPAPPSGGSTGAADARIPPSPSPRRDATPRRISMFDESGPTSPTPLSRSFPQSPSRPPATTPAAPQTVETPIQLPAPHEARQTSYDISFRPGISKRGGSAVFFDAYKHATTSLEFFTLHPGPFSRANADWKYDMRGGKSGPLFFFHDAQLRALQRAETGHVTYDSAAGDDSRTPDNLYVAAAPEDTTDFVPDEHFAPDAWGGNGFLPKLLSGFDQSEQFHALMDHVAGLSAAESGPELAPEPASSAPHLAGPDPAPASVHATEPVSRYQQEAERLAALKFRQATERLTELYSHECAESLHVTDDEFAYIRNLDYLDHPKPDRSIGQNVDLDELLYDNLLWHETTGGGVEELYISWPEKSDVDPNGFIYHEERIAELQHLPRAQRPRMFNAIVKELTDLVKNGTFVDVELPPDRKAIKAKWVLKVKFRADGTFEKDKARLVAKGFLQRLGIDFFACFSPMATMTTVRIIFAVAVHLGLAITHADIPQAFIQAKIDADIWLELPYGTEYRNPITGRQTRVLKLLKSLYGLRQAALAWSRHLHVFLSKLGYAQAAKDQCLYYKLNSSGFILMATEVDDLVITGNNDAEREALRLALVKAFKITTWEDIESFLGMHVEYERDSGVLKMNMIKKIENLFKEQHSYLGDQINGNAKIPLKGEYLHITNETHKLSAVESYVKDNYASIIGTLIFIMICVRPDLAQAISTLARAMHNPQARHAVMCCDVLSYTKGTMKWKLAFRRYGNPIDSVYKELSRTNSQMFSLATNDKKARHPFGGFSDSNHAPASDKEYRSTSGYVMFVLSCLVSWKSKLQSVTAQSTHEAELIALSLAANEAVWIRDLLITIGFALEGHTVVRPKGSEDVPELERSRVPDTDGLGGDDFVKAFAKDDHDDGLRSETESYVIPPIPLGNDNASANIVATNPMTTFRNRHIATRYFQVRNYVRNQQILPTHVPTKMNIADLFTKAIVEYQRFDMLRRACGMVESE